MPSFNKIQLIGNTGSDAFLRIMTSGTPTTSFSLATNKVITNKETNEAKQYTTWFKIKTFGKLAELCNQYVTKGKLIFVEGSLEIHNYTDNQGTPRTSVEVAAEKVIFLWAIDKATEQIAELGDEQTDIPEDSI